MPSSLHRLKLPILLNKHGIFIVFPTHIDLKTEIETMPKNANEIPRASETMLVQNKNVPILLLSDSPSYGTVALRMASAVLEKLHYDVFSLPTALVSNTLNYGKAEILDTTDYLFHSLAVWKELGFSFPSLFLPRNSSLKKSLNLSFWLLSVTISKYDDENTTFLSLPLI